MGIKVIEQSTNERNRETEELFQEIKPLLDDGFTYMMALIQIGKVLKGKHNGCYNRGWFKDLKNYGATQGYRYEDYSGR